MPSIKLANGKAVQDLRVWDGLKWVSREGKVYTEKGWEYFFKPSPSFLEDFTNRTGMILQNAKAITKQVTTAGTSTLSVNNTANFVVGQQITITDGINTEYARVTAVGTNSLTGTSLINTYPSNAIVARTTAVLTPAGTAFDTRQAYTINIT